MKKNKKILTDSFKGSIDDLLNHCSENADYVSDVVEEVEQVQLTDNEAAKMINEKFKYFTHDECLKIVQQIKLEEVRETIDKMINEGLVEVKEYDAQGDPKFVLTERGNKYKESLKKTK